MYIDYTYNDSIRLILVYLFFTWIHNFYICRVYHLDSHFKGSCHNQRLNWEFNQTTQKKLTCVSSLYIGVLKAASDSQILYWSPNDELRYLQFKNLNPIYQWKHSVRAEMITILAEAIWKQENGIDGNTENNTSSEESLVIHISSLKHEKWTNSRLPKHLRASIKTVRGNLNSKITLQK